MFLVITLTAAVFLVQVSGDLPCPSSLAVDISDGLKADDGSIEQNGTRFDKANYFHRDDANVTLGCVCNLRSCIRKCCRDTEIMVDQVCVPMISKGNYSSNYYIYNGTDLVYNTSVGDAYIVYGNSCEGNKTGLLLNLSDKFYVQTTGSLIVPSEDLELGPSEYCIENVIDVVKGTNEFSAIICLPDDEELILYPVSMAISLPFLLITFVVYALLPNRNLHMKSLMCYVMNLFGTYLFLVIIQFSSSGFDDTYCTFIGYFTLFFFFKSFCWMNVICIDMWVTFSGSRGFLGTKSAERKRFIIYCIYAFCATALHISIVLLIQNNSAEDVWYFPGIGAGQCFLSGGYPQLLYLYGPMGIMITINVILYSLTAIKIRRIKKDTKMLKKSESKRHSYENDKQKFNLYLKLLLAMGINWLLEIISFVADLTTNFPTEVWYLTDFFNACYGVIIFFLFVFKRNNWKLLKKRYYTIIGNEDPGSSMARSHTRTTTFSANSTSGQDHSTAGIGNDAL